MGLGPGILGDREHNTTHSARPPYSPYADLSKSIVPTPAAAPFPTIPQFSCQPGMGYIRFSGAHKTTYISRYLDPALGDLLPCTDKSHALKVRFTPSDKPHAIEVAVSVNSIDQQY